jgi:hypothetical protein
MQHWADVVLLLNAFEIEEGSSKVEAAGIVDGLEAEEQLLRLLLSSSQGATGESTQEENTADAQDAEVGAVLQEEGGEQAAQAGSSGSSGSSGSAGSSSSGKTVFGTVFVCVDKLTGRVHGLKAGVSVYVAEGGLGSEVVALTSANETGDSVTEGLEMTDMQGMPVPDFDMQDELQCSTGELQCSTGELEEALPGSSLQ